MPEFTQEEKNLIFLYDPGNLRGLIHELRCMMGVLMPDEKALYHLADKTIRKLENITAADYKVLRKTWNPDDGLLHFDLGLEAAITDNTEKTED